MFQLRSFALTSLAMIAFAGNSLLCRAALKHTTIDAASFTTIRLVAGALVLYLLVFAQTRRGSIKVISNGNWVSAVTLFVYAIGFSFAYVGLPTGTGALLLFGAVQTTMIGHGLWKGERLSKRQTLGLTCAIAGLIILLLPGLKAPPILESAFMLFAGIAWGVYSLRGKGSETPISVTAGNFIRTVPMTAMMSILLLKNLSFDPMGVLYAAVSGALASGVGYTIWYAALSDLKATQAAAVQMSVPVIAAVGGIILLGEPITSRLALASTAILGGIALVIIEKSNSQPGPQLQNN